MNHRQRVIDAIAHKQTQTTPWAFEVTSEFAAQYKRQKPCEDVERDLQSHIMFGKYKKVRWLNETLYEDAFGVQWQMGGDGGDIGIPVNKPVLAATVEDYRFPEIDEAVLEAGLAAMRADAENFRMFRLTYALYERAWSLMGMQDTLMNMALCEAEIMRLMERIAQYQSILLARVLDSDFEGVYFGDDWGQQRGLIMGPAMFRKYIKPFLKELFAQVHAKGKYVLLHSCGDIERVFPDLIEIGLDVYNTVQPEIYDLAKIKREYGADLTFWGAISTQQFLSDHSADEVYQKSIETIQVLGKGGGYLFSPTHAVTPDIPVENILAMKRAAEDWEW